MSANTRRARRDQGRPDLQVATAGHGRGVPPTLIFAVFALVFIALGVNAYVRKSAAFDEPIHLAAGYAALVSGDHRIDPSHPPLIREWAALPLLAMGGISYALPDIDTYDQLDWLPEGYTFAREFLYGQNDADRLLHASRFMVLTLGVLLAYLLFRWAFEWLGLPAAILAVALFVLEPNLAAHATLVTTDMGVACFMLGAVYFTWRLSRQYRLGDACGVAAFTALAVVAKFSGVLIIPIVVLLLALASRGGTAITLRRAAIVSTLMAVATFAAIWAVYGFRYLPSGTPGWTFRFDTLNEANLSPLLGTAVRWVDTYHLLPNAFTQGLVYSLTTIDRLPAFLAGSYSRDGWWYYFPVALAIKTPLALLAMTAAGTYVLLRQRHSASFRTIPFIAVPVLVYMAVSMASGINIGVRHILPIYPLLILTAAAGGARLLQAGRPGYATVYGLIAVGVLELGTAYPYTLTFFNQLVGGSARGYAYLADSNLGWGQGLKALKSWMAANGVARVNLAYFGQADPSYYGITSTYLPGSPRFLLERLGRPELPGYIAISATTLSGVYLTPEWRLFYSAFRDIEPVAVVGHSIRVYRVDDWPEPSSSPATDAATHLELADALLTGLRWPTHALLHYETYLSGRPDDARALVAYATALAASGRAGEAVPFLQRAVAADPENGPAHRDLARAFLERRDIPHALDHAQRAVRLIPEDADVHVVWGRLFAVLRRYAEAEAEFRKALEIAPGHREAGELLERALAYLTPTTRG